MTYPTPHMWNTGAVLILGMIHQSGTSGLILYQVCPVWLCVCETLSTGTYHAWTFLLFFFSSYHIITLFTYEQWALFGLNFKRLAIAALTCFAVGFALSLGYFLTNHTIGTRRWTCSTDFVSTGFNFAWSNVNVRCPHTDECTTVYKVIYAFLYLGFLLYNVYQVFFHFLCVCVFCLECTSDIVLKTVCTTSCCG